MFTIDVHRRNRYFALNCQCMCGLCGVMRRACVAKQEAFGPHLRARTRTPVKRMCMHIENEIIEFETRKFVKLTLLCVHVLTS